MTAPPRVFPGTRTAPSTTLASGGQGDRHARFVLAQCDRCGATGTGVVRGQKLKGVNLASTRGRNRIGHAGCGGTFIAYDIEVRP